MILRCSLDRKSHYFVYNREKYEIEDLILSDGGILFGVFKSIEGDKSIKCKIDAIENERCQISFD